MLVPSCFSSRFSFETCYLFVLVSFHFRQKFFSVSTGLLVTVPDPTSCVSHLDGAADAAQAPAAPHARAEARPFNPMSLLSSRPWSSRSKPQGARVVFACPTKTEKPNSIHVNRGSCAGLRGAQSQRGVLTREGGGGHM